MPAVVELKHWKKGAVEKQPIGRLLTDKHERERKIRHKKRTGHLAVGIRGMESGYYYWSYSGKPEGCCPMLQSIYMEIVEDPHEDETEVMGLYNPDDPKNPIRNPADETLPLPTLNALKTAEWGKKFAIAHPNNRSYILCNIGLLCRRFWCTNSSDSPDNDSELEYIMKSGRANCSVFAYALLRAGGLPPPDGIPKRHLIFSLSIGAVGFAQFITMNYSSVYNRIFYGRNLTATEIALEVKVFCLLGFPLLTLLFSIVATSINCYHGVSTRTPAGVYNLAKLHSDGKTLNYIRRCMGPNNSMTWFIYGMISFGSIVDTILIATSTSESNNSGISITAGYIGIFLFFCAVIIDFSFESNANHLILRESVKRTVCEKSRVTINAIRSSRIVSFFYDNPTVAPDNTSDTEETAEPDYHAMEEGEESKEESDVFPCDTEYDAGAKDNSTEKGGEAKEEPRMEGP